MGKIICPLCQKIPDDSYHIILHCNFTHKLWQEIEPTLKKLHPNSVSMEEKALGIVHTKQTNGILLRNWVTFSLRRHIMQCEREAYHSPNTLNIETSKTKFNQTMTSEMKVKMMQYKNVDFVHKILTHSGILCEKIVEEEYRFTKVFCFN